MIEYYDILNNVAFPVVVALYFMFKVEKSIKNNTEALTQVREVMKDVRRNKTRRN
jgi:hypothetical protein|tara:strand:+ start:1440 stop:1604 length:165 start_codon:yes stop_codon:yes gene_type:complete